MEWLWPLFEPYVRKDFERRGILDPTDDDLQNEFVLTLSRSTVTILVQEPWRGSVRFKGLARHEAAECFDLFNDPTGYLFSRFGGGKFKLNFHQGWNFVATQNFKPEGEERWKELPSIDF